MENQRQQLLSHISNKHLIDARSDSVYQPFREMSFQVSMKKYGEGAQQYNNHYQFSQNSYIPSALNGLQISSNTVDPSKKFTKIAQRQKRYQPIEEGVLRKLQNQSAYQQKVYQYTDLEANDEKNHRYKCIPCSKTPQNRSKFKQNLNERIRRIHEVQQKHQGYNLYSILDEPFNLIRSKI